MSIDNPVLHFGAALGYRAALGNDAVDAMLSAGRIAGRRETGGILIGHYDPSGWHVTVTEATHEPKGSWASWFSFRRGNKGLGDLLRTRWNEERYYVGEWHFHPRALPHPSSSDLREMKRIACDNRYSCQMPLMIILGGDPDARWSLSATLIGPDGAPIALPQVEDGPQPIPVCG